ncbi:MAG TPA: hypothetical protein VKQ70_13200 [Caulobacteraceae bacterium]|jgi:hypothetical protein|nr:hypothetical protein [Caulobacteraceae bacterium]
MARKSSLPHFHLHMPPAIVDVAIFVFSFVAVAAVAGLAAHLVPWS